MTVFYDGTESREGSRLPQSVIDYGHKWNRVEMLTGGDFIVTPGLSQTHKAILLSQKMTLFQVAQRLEVSIPDVIKMRDTQDDLETLFFEYVYRGSIVVQRKSGGDLISSIQGPRLEEALARMNLAVPYRAQRLLLYTGVFGEKGGYVTLDGKKTGLKYMAFAMAITAWCNRGGTVVNLASDDLILPWIKALENQLEEYQRTDTKHVYPETHYPNDMPDEDDVLQLPIEVNDWRKTMVTFPGLGPDRLNSLKERMDEEINGGSLLNALQYATCNRITELHGWGPKSVSNTRGWLGIPDGFELVLQLKSGEKNG